MAWRWDSCSAKGWGDGAWSSSNDGWKSSGASWGPDSQAWSECGSEWSSDSRTWRGDQEWQEGQKRKGTAPAEGQRALKRKSTDEGRSLEAYTYLGGDAKASLPHGDKVKIVHALRPDVGILVLNSLAGECLDAVMWILTGQQPTLAIRQVSVEPDRLRHTLREEYERRQRRWQSTGEKDLPNLLAQIEELNDLDEQIRFVEQARCSFQMCTPTALAHPPM